MSAANPTRHPVQHRGRRIPNLWSRETAEGVVYEFAGKLGGKFKRVKLDAANVTEAVEELQSLQTGVREKRIAVASDRRRLVRDARDDYVDYLKSLTGTKAEKSPRSIEDIESKLDRYVLPVLGDLKLSAVDERDIRDLAKSASGRSRSTAKNVLSTASGFFAWAVREKLATTNPVRVAREVFAEELLPDTEPKQIRALTNDEIARAMEHVSDTFAPIIGVVAESGLRISEVLGFVWGVLDLDAELLSVEGQLGSDKVLRKTTKNKASRVIPISAKCAATLREHRQWMEDEGYPVDAEALVFVTRTGQPQSRRNVLRSWQAALATVGIEGAGLHSLRHSFVSRLVDDNVPVTYAQKLVGHARVETTTGHYLRLRGGDDEQIEKLRSVL